MSFPRYERYRDSGVTWLGEVPEHWNLKPMFATGQEREEKNTGLRELNLLSLSYGRIVQKDIDTSEGLLPESFETYQVICPGDIVFRLTDLQNDKRSLRTAITRERGIITSAYMAFEPKWVVADYLNYLLRAYDLRKVFYAMGSGVRQSMNFADIRRLETIVPTNIEQASICSFLDQETAKIDALIEKQRRLIALLKEKRQAVISHAVTKGLNPAAPMKDWQLCRLKQLTSKIGSGKTPSGGSEVYSSTGIAFIRSQNVYDDGLRLDDLVYINGDIDESMRTTRVLPGDILLNITGASLGRTCLVPDSFAPANVNQHVCIIRLKNADLRGFVALALKASSTKSQIEEFQNGAAREGLNFEQVGQLIISIPRDTDELRAACNLIRNEAEKLDALVGQAGRSLTLLQERRSALISAAVTGKIDVRNHASPKTEVPEEVYELA